MVLANLLLDTNTIPLFSVTETAVVPDVLTAKDTTAFAAFLDLGTYPMFLANDTTFSLNVAPSINTSLVTILALYEVM